ncbi:hypothetical protein APHAL10511_004351 [Amanita phalloides]|nr:hypothetical protein APHAL10511_004351 [Amanita phalloides]
MAQATSTPALPETQAMIELTTPDQQLSHSDPHETTTEGTTAMSNAEIAAEEPEPQNPLTQQFTSEEWEALKAFRKELPTMLQDACEDPLAAGAQFLLWGVNIDPRHPNRDARVSVVLMKFLRARNLSIPDARDMFISTLRWRKTFDIDVIMKEEFPQDIFGQLGHIYGRDKEGRPIVYNLYGANKDLKAVFGDVQRFLRWRVALQEKSILLLDFDNVDQTIQVHDYDGVGLTGRDANSKAAASEATSIFANHYPELLYKKFFINVPTILNWVFWAMKPLISAKTLAKMSVVGSGQQAVSQALSPDIDATQLPSRYGGKADGF